MTCVSLYMHPFSTQALRVKTKRKDGEGCPLLLLTETS